MGSLPQALSDRQHAVVADAVQFLAELTQEGHLRRRSLLAVLSAATVILQALYGS